jgi:hypothetical protein
VRRREEERGRCEFEERESMM